MNISSNELNQIEELEKKIAPSGQWEVNERKGKKELYSVIWV
jgi:hypothetical protein